MKLSIHKETSRHQTICKMTYDDKKWKLLGKKNVFDSKWLSVEDRSYELPDGKVVEVYYHLNRPDYVLILAVDKHQRIVVEKQYRRGVDDFVYELPAGWINKDDIQLYAAKRELLEETGFIGVGSQVFEIYPHPGFCSMKAYLVVLKIQDEKGDEKQEEDETLSYELVDLFKIKKMIADNEIKDMGFLSAFSLLDTMSLG
jgi:8-oxo-dGTP pyrophosphatase MutT (NUDIX family)